MRRLLDVMEVRALGAELGAKRFSKANNALVVELQNGHALGPEAREELGEVFRDALQLAWQERPSVTLKLDAGDDPVALSKSLLRILEQHR